MQFHVDIKCLYLRPRNCYYFAQVKRGGDLKKQTKKKQQKKTTGKARESLT